MISDAVDIGGAGRQVEDGVAGAEIVAADRHGQRLFLRSRDAAHRQRTLGVEEVAVGPAGLGANALAGAVAKLPGDGAERRGFEADVEIDAAAVGRGDDPDLGAGDQPGRDERAAKVVDAVLAEAIARLEPRDQADMACAERRRTADADAAEALHRTGRDGQRQNGGMRLMIDDDVLRADLGQREAARAQSDAKRDTGSDDFVGGHRIPRLDGEAVAQRRRVLPGSLEAGKRDGGEAILLAGLRGQADDQCVAGSLDRRFDRGVIIATRAEQFAQQRGVGARAAVDLRGVGGAFAVGFERRGGAEFAGDDDLTVDAFKAGELDTVAAFGGAVSDGGGGRRSGRRWTDRVGRHHHRRGRLTIERGPVDPKPRHRVERRAGVEVGPGGGRGRRHRRRHLCHLSTQRGRADTEHDGDRPRARRAAPNALSSDAKHPRALASGVAYNQSRIGELRESLVDRPQRFIGGKRDDHAFDLAPMAEAHDIARVAAALGAGRSFEPGIVAEAANQVRGVVQGCASGDEKRGHGDAVGDRSYCATQWAR